MKGLTPLIGALLIAMVPGLCQAGVGPEYNGLASFGISLGAMNWLADSDAREYEGDEFGPGGTAQPRPIGRAAFRYRFNTTWTLAVQAGFGWNSYPESDDLVLWVIPLTAGVERRIGEMMGATTSLCFGGGIYVWGQRRGGEFLRDAVTQQKYHAADPGLYAGLAVETPLSRVLTLYGEMTASYIYSAHSDDFKDRLGGDDVFADLRIGMHYYFDPYRGQLADGPGEDQGR